MRQAQGERNMLIKRIRDLARARKELTRKPAGEVRLPAQVRQRIKEVFGEELSAGEAVARIVSAVREKGDEAVRRYTRLLDRARLSRLEVCEEEIELAHETVDPELALALVQAAERIRRFHEECLRHGPDGFRAKGVGRMVQPIGRVGIYIPGGAAVYPSTVLMTAVPARVAGVGEIVLATPPSPDGSVAPAILVAADIAGADRIFKIGGAQAIAAMAFGTASVPRVDKVCGPGNIFVLLAKKMVYGAVDIDGLAGPSEVMVLADAAASAELCAAELLAQAEHDPLASAILVTTSETLADEVE
ncbi:MAG: histidinol dehydrogenase, partial [Chloroflexota bacterium]